MASIFVDFGVSVLLLETAPTVLPAADADVSAGLQEAFESRGMDIRTGAMVEAVERNGSQLAISFTRGSDQERAYIDAVFAAVGWPASVENMDLDAAGIAHDRHAVPVDGYLRTNVDHIFAAGDVNGRSKLVQSARLQGRTAAWNAVHGPTAKLSTTWSRVGASPTRSTAPSD